MRNMKTQMIAFCATLIAYLPAAVPAPAQPIDLNRVLDLGIEILRKVPQGGTQPDPDAIPPSGPNYRRIEETPRETPSNSSASRSQGNAASRDAIADAQRRLAALGYDPGPADGVAGARTRAAIEAFERDNGLPVTGRLSRGVSDALAQAEPAPRRERAAPQDATERVAGAAPRRATAGRDAGESAAVEIESPYGGEPIRYATRDGRVVLGYPLVKEVSGEPYLRPEALRVTQSAHDIARYFDLVRFAEDPEVLNDPTTAACYARRFLPDEEFDYYHTGKGCTAFGCAGTTVNEGWVGATEFEREDRLAALRADLAELLEPVAPKGPIKALHIQRVQVQEYQADSERFALFDEGGRAKLGGGGADTCSTAVNREVYAEDDLWIGGLPMARDAAVAFTKRLPPDRIVFAGYDFDITYGTTREGNPELLWTLRNVRIWSDAALTDLLHDTNAARKAPDTAAETEPTVMSMVSEDEFLLKYAPQAFDAHQLRERVFNQIVAEQKALQTGERISGNDAFVTEAAVFERAEIEGRAPQFIVNELTPVYLERIAARQVTPSRLVFRWRLPHRSFTYESGRLTYADQQQRSIPTVLFSPEIDTALIDAPESKGEVGRAVIDMPTLFGEKPQRLRLKDPNCIVCVGARPVDLALDRKPIVLPLALSAAEAERLWVEEPCTPPTNAETTKILRRKDLDETEKLELINACRRKSESFANGLVVEFEIETDGMSMVEKDPRYPTAALHARLLGAKLFSPHGDVLKEYAAEDFELAATGLEQAEREQKRQVEAANTAAETEKEKRAARFATMRQRLAEADVVGLKIGMTFAEAEAIIGSEMQIGEKYAPKTPFAETRGILDEFVTFVAADKSQSFVLYGHPGVSDEVLGIGRAIRLAEGADRAAISEQLAAKYGEPITQDLWAPFLENDPGLAHMMDADNFSYRYLDSPCNVYVVDYIPALFNPGHPWFPDRMVDFITPYRNKCGRVMQTYFTEDNSYMAYILIDFERYAAVYDRAVAAIEEAEQAAKPALPKF